MNGHVYSWGRGTEGQCANGTTDDVQLPKRIQFFDNKKVIDIKIGGYHSCVEAEDGDHYLFGDNEYNISFNFNDGEMKVLRPHRVGAYIKHLTEMDEILDIVIGREITAVICSKKSTENS